MGPKIAAQRRRPAETLEDTAKVGAKGPKTDHDILTPGTNVDIPWGS
ncbi:MAG TPA: hypothetical protein PLO76_08460 [Elusimicrobiota bacterium]|nr:hypothetical protein [Elusimicrobiota bacterium]